MFFSCFARCFSYFTLQTTLEYRHLFWRIARILSTFIPPPLLNSPSSRNAQSSPEYFRRAPSSSSPPPPLPASSPKLERILTSLSLTSSSSSSPRNYPPPRLLRLSLFPYHSQPTKDPARRIARAPRYFLKRIETSQQILFCQAK